MSDIKNFKANKKAKIIIEELDKIDSILETTLFSLKSYHYYIPVTEILSNIKNNKTMLKIFRKKQLEIIDKYNNKE